MFELLGTETQNLPPTIWKSSPPLFYPQVFLIFWSHPIYLLTDQSRSFCQVVMVSKTPPPPLLSTLFSPAWRSPSSRQCLPLLEVKSSPWSVHPPGIQQSVDRISPTLHDHATTMSKANKATAMVSKRVLFTVSPLCVSPPQSKRGRRLHKLGEIFR